MKSFKNYINEGIITGRGGAADKKTILQEKYTREIREWCKKYAKNSDINKLNVIIKGGKVICTGSIGVTDKNIVELLPFKIDVLEGHFDCSECDSLIDLQGAPEYVDGNFYCYRCTKLESLEGAPKEVGGHFNCSVCDSLIDLQGAPKHVDGNFHCYRCTKLESLKGAPKEVGGYFDCSFCQGLTSLEGAPKTVKGNFNCFRCTKLESLEGAPKTVKGNFNCSYCGQDFSKEDVESICKVSGRVLVQNL